MTFITNDEMDEVMGRVDARVREQHAEIGRLHQLLEQARNWIDPEEHPEWEKTVSDDLVRCDEHIERLTEEREALRLLIAQLVGALRKAHSGEAHDEITATCCYIGRALAAIAEGLAIDAVEE